MNRAATWFDSIFDIRRPQMKLFNFAFLLKLPLNKLWMISSFDGEFEVVSFWTRTHTGGFKVPTFALWLIVASVDSHARSKSLFLKRYSRRMTEASFGFISAVLGELKRRKKPILSWTGLCALMTSISGLNFGPVTASFIWSSIFIQFDFPKLICDPLTSTEA